MKKALLTALLVGMSAAPAQQLFAKGFNYNYVQGQYVKPSMDNVDGGSGFAITGSVALNDNFALNAGYNDASFDNDIDASGYNVGVTYHMPVADSTDILLNAAFEQAEASAFGISTDDTGYSIGAGIRQKVASAVELEAGIYNVSIFDDSNIGFGAAALVDVAKNIALGVSYENLDESNTIGVGVRAGF